MGLFGERRELTMMPGETDCNIRITFKMGYVDMQQLKL
jgi:hypothetical protein